MACFYSLRESLINSVCWGIFIMASQTEALPPRSFITAYWNVVFLFYTRTLCPCKPSIDVQVWCRSLWQYDLFLTAIYTPPVLLFSQIWGQVTWSGSVTETCCLICLTNLGTCLRCSLAGLWQLTWRSLGCNLFWANDFSSCAVLSGEIWDGCC